MSSNKGLPATLWFGLVTLMPEMFGALTSQGVSGRAIGEGRASLDFWNPRDFTQDKHRTVDDKPYGGGAGMLMKVEPLCQAIEAAKTAGTAKQGRPPKVVYLAPQGKRFTQAAVAEWRDMQAVVVVCGRYEGIDQRVIDRHVDEMWSLGDFVLSGGELTAMAIIDAVTRTLPGALGSDESAKDDSFSDGLLEYPHYTRPAVFENQAVPEVLLSGDHAAIERWRLKQSLGRTWLQRPGLLEKKILTCDEQQLLAEFIQHYEKEN